MTKTLYEKEKLVYNVYCLQCRRGKKINEEYKKTDWIETE